MKLSKRMTGFANAPFYVRAEASKEEAIAIVDGLWKDITLLEWQPEVIQLEAKLQHMTDIANTEHASSAHIAMRNGELEAKNERLRELCNDVALGHQNPYDSNYNECDKEPCAWCEEFQALGGV